MADAYEEDPGPAEVPPAEQALAALGPETDMTLAMSWIGYGAADAYSANWLANEIGYFESLVMYQQSDIADMFKEQSKNPTRGNRRLNFPMLVRRNMSALLDWIQDRKRINAPMENPITAAGIVSQDEFRSAINLSAERRLIRKKEKDAHTAQLKIASPGKLKDEKSWADWLTGLHTTLSLIRGVSEVPLNYVIREHMIPPEGESYTTFDEECIAKAPLVGTAFDADASTVHLIIKPLCIGEHAEQWIKPGFTKKNGRDDLAKLMAHYQGEGMASRRIHTAEQLWDTLHYKQEKSMKFSDFLSKAKLMLNIYEENKEAKPPAAQVRWLLDKISNPALTATVESLRTSIELDPVTWTFNKCANHIASNIRTIAPGTVRSVSAVGSNGGTGRQGAYKDGAVFTGTYTGPEWQALSKEEKSLVFNARKTTQKGSGGKGPGQKPNPKKVKALTKTVKSLKKQVSALKKRSNATPSDDSSSGSDEKDEPMNDAGNAFGGRAGKKKKKKTE